MISQHSPIGVLLDSFAQAKRSRGQSEQTIERVRINVSNLAKDMCITGADQISNEIIEEWAAKKRDKGVSQSTIYAYFNSLRAFLGHLDELGVAYPAKRTAVYCKPNYKRMVVLRADDVKRIADCAHSYKVSVLIRLLYCTGMRLGEALQIRPDDVKHDNTIWVNGKWCKSRHVILWPDLKSELNELAPDGGYCFTRARHPDEPMDRKIAYMFIKRAMVKAGYPDAYPHSLRHTFATENLRGGASTEHVRRQLGHTHTKTTERYLHLITDDLIKSHGQFLPRI